jgi:hypothetical protein
MVKIRILTEFLSRPNPRYIYIYVRLHLVEPVLEHKTVHPNPIPSSRYCPPKFGAVPTPASNYSQSVHRLPNPRVPLRSSRRGLRRSAFGSSIGSPNLRQSTDFLSAPARVFFPGEKPPLLHLGFLVFSFSRPCRASPTLPSPSPAAVPLPPPFPLPDGAPFPLPDGGGGGRRRRPCSNAPRAPLPGSEGRAPRAPCGRVRPRPARPDLPCAAPSSSPPLSSMDGRKKMRGRRRWQSRKFSPRELQYGLKYS